MSTALLLWVSLTILAVAAAAALLLIAAGPAQAPLDEDHGEDQ